MSALLTGFSIYPHRPKRRKTSLTSLDVKTKGESSLLCPDAFVFESRFSGEEEGSVENVQLL